MLDIFEHNAFTVGRMSAAVREMKFKPGRIAELGLFNTESIDTTIAMFEKKGDLLVLVPPTPRGGPGTTMEKEKRDLRAIPIPHFELDDAVYADEVQNVRAFGQEQALETVVAKVAQRQQTMVNSFAVTEEHARMGAVTGVVTYSDGSTLDLFNTFGVTQEAELNFDLANKTAGALRTYTQVVRRQVLDLLGGVGVTGLRAFCGDNFFDALIANEEVRATYLQTRPPPNSAPATTTWEPDIFGAFNSTTWSSRTTAARSAARLSSTPTAFTSSPKASRVCSAPSTPGRLRGNRQHDGPAPLLAPVEDGERQGSQARSADERASDLRPPEGPAEGQARLVRPASPTGEKLWPRLLMILTTSCRRRSSQRTARPRPPPPRVFAVRRSVRRPDRPETTVWGIYSATNAVTPLKGRWSGRTSAGGPASRPCAQTLGSARSRRRRWRSPSKRGCDQLPRRPGEPVYEVVDVQPTDIGDINLILRPEAGLSLSRLAMRIAAARAIRAQLAGDRVFDNAVDPINEKVAGQATPIVTVTTDDEETPIEGRDLWSGERDCQLVIEAAIATALSLKEPSA